LARDPPFNADSPLALLAAVVSDPLPSIRLIRPDVPPELEAVIAKCLEKNPDNRYQTVSELADALAPFAPRSMPSVTRISGILRATSLRPPPADKSPSSDRTLQSPTPVTGDERTEEQRVKIVTPAPAARSEKSTRTDWEATPSEAGRSRRRLVIGVIGAVALTVAVVVWQRRPLVTMETSPEPSAARAGVSASGTEAAPSAAPAAPGTASSSPEARRTGSTARGVVCWPVDLIRTLPSRRAWPTKRSEINGHAADEATTSPVASCDWTSDSWRSAGPVTRNSQRPSWPPTCISEMSPATKPTLTERRTPPSS
jgi:serine/threonine protein kinase